MANKKITELTAATSAAAADVFVVVQGGTTKQIPKSALAATALEPGTVQLAGALGGTAAAPSALGYADAAALSTALAAKADATATTTALAGKVDTTRTVNGHALSADVTVTKADVGLGNADNTADAAKPVSAAQQTAIDAKVQNSLAASTTVAPSATAVNTALAAKADLVGGFLPTSQLPTLAINEVYTVASQSTMLAVTAQRGDMAIRTDSSPAKVFVLASDSPGTLADWKEITAVGAVQSINGQSGVVVLAKGDIGLGNVDNTPDTAKPVSTAQQTALNAKAADSAVVHNTGNETIAGIKTFSSAPVVPAGSFANAALANMAASTVKGNTSGGAAAPSDITLSALAAALGVTSGGVGQIRAAAMGSSTAVPAATAAATEMTRITIPGGSLGTKGVARILYRLRRDGTTDAGTFSVHIGSISGTTNQILSFTSFTGSSVAEEGELLLLGNGADQSSVMRQNTGGVTALVASASGNATNFTVDTSADWVVIFAGTTGATNNLIVESAVATISNPSASSYVATYANIGGLPSDDPDLVSYVAGVVDPGVNSEAAGRALTQADNGKTLTYTGAGAAGFTVPNTLTAPFSCEVVQWSTGAPTFISDGTSVLRVPTGKSATAASQYDGVAIQLISTGPVTVRII